MGWATAFGSEYDVPKTIKRMVEIGMLKDMSWKNDSCPSFGFFSDDEKEITVRIWVEHPDAEKRELGGDRYAVSVSKSDEQLESFSTDNVNEAVAKWQEFMGKHILN